MVGESPEPCLDETGDNPHGGARYSSRWSPEEDRQLTELWDSGMEARAIGRKLKRTPSGVRSRVSNIGLAPRQQSSSRIRRLSHVIGEEASDEWYESQQWAFVNAMLANPDERPSDMPEAERGHVNFIGRITPRRLPPSWSSMGDVV
jgi:hypothetical protein